MTYRQWETLLLIYQRQVENRPFFKIQCPKSLMDACLKKGWIEEIENDRIVVSNKGIEDAKEIGELYPFRPNAQSYSS